MTPEQMSDIAALQYKQKNNPEQGLTVKERATLAAFDMYRRDAIEQASNAIGCMMVYLYNVAPMDVAIAVYGDGHAHGYLCSKADEIAKNPVRWYGTLDYTSQRNLASAVVDRYADTLIPEIG